MSHADSKLVTRKKGGKEKENNLRSKEATDKMATASSTSSSNKQSQVLKTLAQKGGKWRTLLI